MSSNKDLPHPADVLTLRDWVYAGCPVSSRDHDARGCVKTLVAVLQALPRLDPLYCYGSRENEKAMSEAAIAERIPWVALDDDD